MLIINLTDPLQQTASLNAKNVTVCTQSSIANLVTNLISNLMRVFIPFTVMVILNFLVARNLKKSKSRVGQIANVTQIASQLLQNNQNGRQISNRQFRFMVSTLIVDFMYLIFYLPIAVSLTVRTYDMFSNSLTSDPVANGMFSIYSSLAQMFALGHSSVLFFLFLIFNRIFRAELIILLRLDKILPTLKPGSTVFFSKVNIINNNTTLKKSYI